MYMYCSYNSCLTSEYLSPHIPSTYLGIHIHAHVPAMPRMPKMYSPYGPRPKRSAQLILIWMAILVVALVVTFYLTSRERDASYAGMKLADEAVGKEPVGEKVVRMVP
ncbi:hypothetical protein GGS26DRAFT_571630 [Hypomontagnella submonticulosa]|nr:hypothetical protein GGS26DRAFT_571630 [Hypomontagnella submonticulosa]